MRDAFYLLRVETDKDHTLYIATNVVAVKVGNLVNTHREIENIAVHRSRIRWKWEY